MGDKKHIVWRRKKEIKTESIAGHRTGLEATVSNQADKVNEEALKRRMRVSVI